ncbi:MAG TPA: tripartite tricarboxylate transporter substrate-binding protein, partial [Burkholderiales bacterium]|nr:tripartite tricarboxylate transporter substrate-binding protein [Burkholderiales bacterium]
MKWLNGIVAYAVVFTSVAVAQSYPGKPIRLISPYAAGGGSDTLARIIGQKLFESWNQPVVVDNRPSSGGNLGAELVAK